MKRAFVGAFLVTFAFTFSLLASKEEKNALKLEEALFIIGLTAAVTDGRTVVNKVMAEHLGVTRQQLVAERKETTFPYGELFAVHEFARLGNASFKHVAQDIKEGQSLLKVSTEHQADLKKILTSARKLNKAIDRELDRIAKSKENGEAEEIADSYDPTDDFLSADTSGFTAEQLSLASERIYRRGGSAAPRSIGATSGAGSVTCPDQQQSGRVGSSASGGRRRGGGHGPGL